MKIPVQHLVHDRGGLCDKDYGDRHGVGVS